jgi:Phage capsid family
MDLTYERLSDKTVADLTRTRANDFVRAVGLQAKFAGDPNAQHLAIRSFPVHYPRSLNVPLFEKAAVAVGTTLDSTWAGPLSPLRPLAEAFVALLRPRTLLGRIPGLREVPPNVSVSAQTTGGTYGWVGQGAPAPVTKSDFATVTLPPAKCGGIVVVSEELAELSTPAAVNVMREEMIAGCAQFLDTQFVDPAVAAVANVSPGSITNGASSTASAGTSQANANTDIQLLITNFIAANPSVENMVLLMKPANAVAVARATNTETLG